jgi:hypothetical protein
MKKIIKILGLTLVVIAILAIALAGTVSAAGDGTQNRGAECLGGECPNPDCVCDGLCNDCEPNEYLHEYLEAGPHGPQNAR